MGILFKHIVRNVSQNKFRSFSMITIVALAVMVSFISLSLQDVIDKTYSSVYNASIGSANVTLEAKDGKPFKNDVVIDDTSVLKSSPTYDLNGKYVSGETVSRVLLRGVDLAKFVDIDGISLVESPNNNKLNSNEGIISLKTAENYGLSVGSEIAIEVNGENVPILISGIGEMNRTFYEEKGSIQIITSIENTNRLNKTTNQLTKLRVELKNPSSSEIKKIKAANQQLKVYEGEEFESLHFQMQSVNGAMIAIMCIILIIGAYIISSIVKIIIIDRTKVLATLRSTGASKRKIFKILLMEFLFYGLSGSIIGIIFSVFLLPKVADLFNQYKDYGVKTIVQYDILYLLIAILLGVLLPPIMAITKIRKENKKSLKNSILMIEERGEIPSLKRHIMITIIILLLAIVSFFINTTDNFVLGIVTITLFVISGAYLVQLFVKLAPTIGEKLPIKEYTKIAMKNSALNRYAQSNSSMIVSIMLIFTIILSIVVGIRSTAQMDLASYGFDIITVLNKTNIEETEFEKYPEIEGVFSSYEEMAFGDYANGYARVYGIDDFPKMNQYMQAINYEGDNLDAALAKESQGIVIDKYWAKVQGIEVGDKMVLYKDNARKNRAGEFTVVDLWDCSKGTTDRVFVGISLNTYKKLFSTMPERMLFKTDAKPENLVNDLKRDFIDTDLSITSTSEFLEEQLNTVNIILSLLIASIILAGVVIIIGISCNLIVSFSHRKHEYAILYSTSMSFKQLKRMMIVETVTSYISISIVLLVLSAPLVYSIRKMTSGLGLVIDFPVSLPLIVGILIITAIILSLTVISPIKKMKKMNIMEELKYE